MLDKVDRLTAGSARQDDYSPLAEAEMLDFGRIFRSLLRRGRLILVIAGVFAGFGFLSSVLTPKLYYAQAVMMLGVPTDRVVDSLQVQPTIPPDAAMVASAIEDMRSRTLAGKLVDKLQLTKNAEWSPAVGGGGAVRAVKDMISGLLGKRNAPNEAAAREATIDRVIAATTVRRRQVSYAVDLGITSRAPGEAALIANTWAELYLDNQLESRFESSRRANVWLSERLGVLREEVAQKESLAGQYRAQSGLLTADGSTLTESRIQNVQNAVLVARSDLAERSARLQQAQRLVQGGGSPETIGAVLNSETIRQLRVQESDFTRRLSDMQQRYGPLHPGLVKARSELEDVKTQIQAELVRIVSNLTNELEVSKTRLDTLNASLAAAQADLTTNNQAVVRLRELERDAAATRSVYETYLQRLQEISDQQTLKSPDARIVSRAPVPQRTSSPSVPLNTAMWFALGLLAAFSAAFVMEAVDDRLESADDVERRTSQRAIASVPALGEDQLRARAGHRRTPDQYLFEEPGSAFAEGFRVIRSAVRHFFDRRNAIVAITSALPEEGKTTVALCLARISAMGEQRVLLVDCDARRGGLTYLVGMEVAGGIAEAIEKRADWRQFVIQDTYSKAQFLLASDEQTFSTRDLIDNEGTAEVLKQMREEYDLVILDCPPILAVADSRTLAEVADGTVVVVSARKTPARASRNAIRQIQQSGARIIGVALNNINPTLPGQYSYGEALYFTKGHKYYAITS